MNAIEISNLNVEFKEFSLRDVNLSLPSGCIMSLIGKNGAGKTTLIRAILKQLKADSGSIQVLGKDMSLCGVKIFEQIGFVPDKIAFHGFLNLKDINRIFGGIYKTWDENAFFSYVKRFELGEKKKISEYSRGMEVKLMIAAALSHDTRLLILDEALNGLDPVARADLLDLLLDFVQDESHSVLISSHILSGLESITDYVTLLEDGRVVFSESKEELLESYVIAKCSKEQFYNISGDDIAGYRENSFGVEVLIRSTADLSDMVVDRPTVEDIMVFLSQKELYSDRRAS